VQFRKGQRKDTVMAEYLGKFHQQEGVVFVGKAHEKTAAGNGVSASLESACTH
jgi:hypothetical protein